MFKLNYINILPFLILVFVFYQAQSLFSNTYRKCQIFKKTKAKNIGDLREQRVPIINEEYYIQPLIQTKMPLQYRYMDYFYNSYIGAGGSGQVFLVQDLQKNEQKIFKRFFKEKKNQFQEENFIMHKLNYSIEWTRDYQILQNNKNSQSQEENQDQNNKNEEPQLHYNQYIGQMVSKQATIAIYPSKESYSLKELQFDPVEAKMIFFKLVKQLKKTHSNGIIHNDLKLGNILINSIGFNFKMFEAQLIDWNLASFYYLGYESSMKKGTVCYYSPQLLLRTNHITPAIDVWSLAVVLFTYFTERKPFFYKCKQDNLRAIVSLVGGKKIIELIEKYGYNYQPSNMNLINQILQNPDKFPALSVKDAIPHQRSEFFTDELIQIFQRMLQPDPQKRITISELLTTNYFKSLRKLPEMGYMKKLQEQKKNKKIDNVVENEPEINSQKKLQQRQKPKEEVIKQEQPKQNQFIEKKNYQNNQMKNKKEQENYKNKKENQQNESKLRNKDKIVSNKILQGQQQLK